MTFTLKTLVNRQASTEDIQKQVQTSHKRAAKPILFLTAFRRVLVQQSHVK